MTDMEKFLHLMDDWGLVNEELSVYQCEDTQTHRIYIFAEVWTFDMNGEFLYIHDTEYDDYLHKGGERMPYSGREHLHEN